MNKPIEAGSGKRKKQKKVLGYTKNSTFYSLKDYITSDIASGYNAYDTQEVRLSQIRKLLYNHGLSKNKNFQGMKPGLERRYPGLVRIDELAKNLFWEGFSYSTYDAKCEMNRFCIDDIPEFKEVYAVELSYPVNSPTKNKLVDFGNTPNNPLSTYNTYDNMQMEIFFKQAKLFKGKKRYSLLIPATNKHFLIPKELRKHTGHVFKMTYRNEDSDMMGGITVNTINSKYLGIYRFMSNMESALKNTMLNFRGGW